MIIASNDRQIWILNQRMSFVASSIVYKWMTQLAIIASNKFTSDCLSVYLPVCLFLTLNLNATRNWGGGGDGTRGFIRTWWNRINAGIGCIFKRAGGYFGVWWGVVPIWSTLESMQIGLRINTWNQNCGFLLKWDVIEILECLKYMLSIHYVFPFKLVGYGLWYWLATHRPTLSIL